MAYLVELTARVEREVEEAVSYLTRYSPDKGMLLSYETDRAIESLAESPARCPFAPECREDDEFAIRQLLVDQYRILFEIGDETVTVFHFRHQKRQLLSKADLQNLKRERW